MESNTIAAAAKKCDGNFSVLLNISQSQISDTIDDERARFRVWAGHIGAFAKHHASLDYRLRESDTVRGLVISQLGILERSLLQLRNPVLPEHTDRVKEPSRFKSTVIEPSGFKSTVKKPSGFKSTIKDNHTVEHRDTHSVSVLINNPLDDIRGALDRLDRLAKAIRLPGIVSQSSKANKYRPKDEFGADVVDAFHEYSLQIIRNKLAGTPEFLQLRLSRANSSRRRLFLYRRKHQQILSTQEPLSREPYPGPVNVQIQSSPSSDPLIAGTSPFDLPSPMSGPSVPSPNPIRPIESSAGKATTFIEERFRVPTSSKAPTSTGGTSVANLMESSRLPPAPNVPSIRGHFECPYCCQLTPIKYLQKRYWRQHLIKDLEPYICLFEDCQQADEKFHEQSQWVDHLKSHVHCWVCRFPHANGQKSLNYPSGEDYMAHLREHTNGKSLTQAQIELLTRQNASPDPIPIKSCPMCGVTLSDLDREKDSKDSEHSMTSVTFVQMKRHIASHLVMLASYSLPWLDDLRDNVSSDAPQTPDSQSSNAESAQHHESRRRRNSNDFSSVSSLEFSEPDSEHEDRDLQQWNFVPKIPYAGIEYDTKLASFRASVNEKHQSASAKLSPLGAGLAIAGLVTGVHGFPLGSHAIHSDIRPHLELLKDELSDTQSGEHTSTTASNHHSEVEDGSTGDIVQQYLYPCFSSGTRKPCPSFVGREHDLETLDRLLLSELDSNTPSFLILSGMGGVGKSELAVTYANSRRQKFDVIILFDMRDSRTFNASVLEAVVKLGLGDERIDSTESRRRLDNWIMSITAPPKNSSQKQITWLLIFDAVSDARSIGTLYPKRGHGSVVITTRNPLLAINEEYVHHKLQPLSRQESKALITRTTDLIDNRAEKGSLTRIVDAVGGLPIALEKLADLKAASPLFYQDVEKLMKYDSFSGLLSSWPSELGTFFEFDRLPASALALLQTLSLMDTIPPKIFDIRTSSSLFNGEGGLIDTDGLNRAVIMLYQSGLLIDDETEGEVNSHKIHILVKSLARNTIHGDILGRRLEACLDLFHHSWPPTSIVDRYDGNAWPWPPRCKIITANVLALQHNIDRVIGNNEPKDREPIYRNSRPTELLNKVGEYLFAEEFHQGAVIVANIALNLSRLWNPMPRTTWVNELSGNSHTVARAHSYALLGKIIRYTHQVQIPRGKVYGFGEGASRYAQFFGSTTDPDESLYSKSDQIRCACCIWEGLGVTFACSGDPELSASENLDEAMASFQKSKGIRCRHKGTDHTAIIGHAIIATLQNKPELAISVLESLLSRNQSSIYGWVRYVYGNALHKLADQLDETARHIQGREIEAASRRASLRLEAEKLYLRSEKSYQDCRTALEPKKSDAYVTGGAVAYKLAHHHMRSSSLHAPDPDAALEYSTECVKIFKSGPGTIYAPELARAYLQQATIYRGMKLPEQVITKRHGLAAGIRATLLPQENREGLPPLQESDFDALVPFWSR